MTELLVMGRHLRNRWGGVYEVLTGLLTALDRVAGGQGCEVRLLLPEPGLEPPGLTSVKTVVLSRGAQSRLLWDHVTVPAYANARQKAVLYNPGIVLPAGLRAPSVISIHDMLYFPRPELGGRSEYLRADRLYMRQMIARSLRKADVVHVPSKWTRRELLEIFPQADAGKLRVWPYGVDAARWAGPEGAGCSSEDPDPAVIEEPYFIYPGGLSRRKNVGIMLKAMKIFRERHPGHRLLLTGGAKRTLQEEGLENALAAATGEGTLIRLGEVGQARLAALYRRARALIYPSLYEGFGLPPLEAQAAGCPVICSQAASLPEVAGEAALMFDPARVDSLVEAMEQVTQASTRERLVQAGRENARQKSWDVMALEILKLESDFQKSSRRLRM